MEGGFWRGYSRLLFDDSEWINPFPTRGEILKKIVAIIFVLVLGIFVFTFTTLYANEINVTIDGAAIDFEGQGPTIVDGRTLVPIREVFEHLGFNVVWYEGGMVTLTREDYDIFVFSDNPIYLVNEDILWFQDVPPQNIGGRTMLPIRELVRSNRLFCQLGSWHKHGGCKLYIQCAYCAYWNITAQYGYNINKP